MSRVPPSWLPELAGHLSSSLASRLQPGVRILVAGVHEADMSAALRDAGYQTTLLSEPSPDVVDTAIVLSTDASTPPLHDTCKQLTDRLSPGAVILWATATARQADRLRAALRLNDDDWGVPLSLDALTAGLQATGADVERLDDLSVPPDADLRAVVDAVAEAGGDAARLRQDLAMSHHVVQARMPRRRTPRQDASARAVRSCVEGAEAAGVQVGGRSHDPQEAEVPAVAARVSIVIPVFNGAELTEKCLYGIAGNTGEGPGIPEYEVIVVDNGSEDWTMYLLHAMEGDLHVLSNDRNLGFARACNQGATASDAEYVLFLNNDTVPHADWLTHMVAVADSDDKIGIVGARLLYPDGSVQHAGLHLVNGIPDHQYRGVSANDERVCRSRDLDMVTGACLLIRRDLFESLGGFDTQFVNGVEDVDLCLRAREHGYRVVYCADAVVDHHEAQSKGRFDHVQENVQKFLARWQGRFDTDGRLVVGGQPSPPVAAYAPADQPVTDPALSQAIEDVIASSKPVVPARVNWEGSFFLHSSLAHVNRELATALLAGNHCELGLQPFEPDQFDPAQDPRLAPLVERMGTVLPDADVHVRHRWPPDFSAVPSGRYALMQPWEFGRVPRAWVQAIGDGIVDQVWAYTNYVRDCYVDSGVDPARVAVVPAGVDTDLFKPGLSPHPAVQSEQGFRFLFVGGTLYRKGIDVLLEAWRRAFSATDDVVLVIKDMGVGTFYRGQTAEKSIRELQQDPGCAAIEYLPQDLPADEIPRLYAAGDALVHPYRGEGFGLPVAEAMACGLPVVLSRGGACDDFCPTDIGYGVDAPRQPIDLGGNHDVVGQAWQLQPDVDDLARQMRAVFEDRQQSEARGRAGIEYIAANTTWTHAAMAASAAIDRLRSGDLDAAPRVSGFAAEASAPSDTAIVLLGDQSAANNDAPALSEAFGRYHRFALDTGTGHALGEQLEAVRTACQENGDVEYLLVLSPDVWDLTSSTTSEELRRLQQHLCDVEDLGLVTPASGGQGTGLVDAEYPGASCTMCRLKALADVGGFDGSFQSTAVLANTARSMRRKNWRVAAAADVVAEDVDGESGQVVALGGGSVAHTELSAVRAMESGDRRRDAGDVHAATQLYHEALGLKPDFVETILVMADAHVEARDADAALSAVRRLVDLDPDSSFSHNYAGLVAARAGQSDAARASFSRAVEIDPSLVDARVNLGVIEWEQRNLEEALLQFGEASKLDPFNRDLICNLGLVYGQIDDPQAAVELYQGYLEQHPEDDELVVRLGRAQLSSGDAVAAKATARALLQSTPGHEEAQNLLTEIDQGLGEDETAQG